MTERQVLRVAKSRYDNIVALCGNWGDVNRVSTADAVKHIKSGEFVYYVNKAEPKAYLEIFDSYYLRTDKNARAENKLENLPLCSPSDFDMDDYAFEDR